MDHVEIDEIGVEEKQYEKICRKSGGGNGYYFLMIFATSGELNEVETVEIYGKSMIR